MLQQVEFKKMAMVNQKNTAIFSGNYFLFGSMGHFDHKNNASS